MLTKEKKITIAVFTGSRAEYGLLKHLIYRLKEDNFFKLKLIITGSHLSKNNGFTIKEILKDGNKADYEIPLPLDKKDPISMGKLASEAMKGVCNALEVIKPHLFILLGDRYETFAAAGAAHLYQIPILHIHGGESTLGALDDQLRHAISQLSTWHFTASEVYRQKVLDMVGRKSNRVFISGPMAIDSLLKTPRIERLEFEKVTGFKFGEQNLLVTYHPETKQKDNGVNGFINLLGALEQTPCNILFTNPNADSGGDVIFQKMQDFIKSNHQRSWNIASLGQELYFCALELFEAVAGNSSSGIIEAPLTKIPVVNIGNRQTGRLRHENILDVSPEMDDIFTGLNKALKLGSTQNLPRQRLSINSSPSLIILKWIKNQSRDGFGK